MDILIVYYFLFVFIGLLAFLENCSIDVRLRGALNVFVFLTLLIFYGLRFDVGNDWHVYYKFFNVVEPIESVIGGPSSAPNFYDQDYQVFEVGFRVLNAVVKSVTSDFQWLVFIISAFNLSLLYSFFYDQKIKYINTVIVVFLSIAMFRDFDVLRQSITFYIFLYSLRYLRVGFFRYSAINLLGCLFHMGALIFLIFYPVLKARISRGALFILLVLYVGTIFFQPPLLSFLLNLIQGVEYTSAFTSKLGAMNEYLNFPRELGLTITLPSIFFLCILISKYNIYNDLAERDRIAINLFLCYVLVCVLGSELNEFVVRFGFYFYIGIALFFSYMHVFFNGRFRIFIALLPVVFSIVKLSLMMLVPATKLSYTPYTNYIFSSSDDREARVFERQFEVFEYYQGRITEK